MPVVLSPSEVRRVLDQLTGVPRMVATLLYGAGLRLQECLELAGRIWRDERFGPPTRLHLHESVIQRAVAEAGRRAGLTKRVGCHTYRHPFATHLVESIYTHVLNRGGLGVKSPLDRW